MGGAVGDGWITSKRYVFITTQTSDSVRIISPNLDDELKKSGRVKNFFKFFVKRAGKYSEKKIFGASHQASFFKMRHLRVFRMFSSLKQSDILIKIAICHCIQTLIAHWILPVFIDYFPRSNRTRMCREKICVKFVLGKYHSWFFKRISEHKILNGDKRGIFFHFINKSYSN